MAIKVLVVDDEPETVRLLSMILEMNNFETMKALNGAEALKLAQADTPPQAMLLDIMLPDIDGLEICRRVRANQATAKMAIVMVTASADVTIETRGKEAGADRVLRKPITIHMLRTELDTVLRARGFIQ